MCGDWGRTEAAEGDAGRVSAGHSKWCQIQKTSGKWGLIHLGVKMGERNVSKIQRSN